MQRREFLCSLAALGFAARCLGEERPAGTDLDNPYANVDWGTWEYIHSMSHQHQGQTDASRDVFREMGYRHFAFSNYYPSAPTPVPDEYRDRHPEILAAPNAEQHSFTDAGLHFNGLGSRLATGYGQSLGGSALQACPLVHRFENLNVFDAERPALGVYRIDVTLEKVEDNAVSSPALLTIRGATECDRRAQFADLGAITDRPLTEGAHTIHFRMTAPDLEAELNYDKTQLTVTRVRVMQGTNRPWREMFRAALDGEVVDGRREGGLVSPDGGGITLNHPYAGVSEYTPMLDYDPRVLGIEVWNQHMGFGGKGDGDASLHFYRLWDDLLRTGRRCWGFFVKDHMTKGRGRNVLLVPPLAKLPRDEQDAAALRAYRQGTFFGSVAAMAVDKFGDVTAPYDSSEFRFSRIAVRRDAEGNATALEVEVTGNDREKRPSVQIRVITDEGTALIVDSDKAVFPLKRDPAGRLVPSFVRVEAFAYPRNHLRGTPLSAETMRKLNLYEIARLNDHEPQPAEGFLNGKNSPPPIVDMIFSQPLLRV